MRKPSFTDSEENLSGPVRLHVSNFVCIRNFASVILLWRNKLITTTIYNYNNLNIHILHQLKNSTPPR